MWQCTWRESLSLSSPCDLHSAVTSSRNNRVYQPLNCSSDNPDLISASVSPNLIRLSTSPPSQTTSTHIFWKVDVCSPLGSVCYVSSPQPERQFFVHQPSSVCFACSSCDCTKDAVKVRITQKLMHSHINLHHKQNKVAKSVK